MAGSADFDKMLSWDSQICYTEGKKGGFSMPPRGHSSSSRSSSSSHRSSSSRSSSSRSSSSRSSSSRSSGSRSSFSGRSSRSSFSSSGPSRHSSTSRNSRPVNRQAVHARPRVNQPTGFRGTGYSRPSYHYGRSHDYVFFPVGWTDETTGRIYEKGYYDGLVYTLQALNKSKELLIEKISKEIIRTL